MKSQAFLITVFTLGMSICSYAQNRATFDPELTGYLGRVGIGTTTPNAKLEVNPGTGLGAIYIRTANAQGVQGPVSTPYALRVNYENTLFTPSTSEDVFEIDYLGRVNSGPGVVNTFSLNSLEFMNVENSLGVYDDGSNFIRMGHALQTGMPGGAPYTGIMWSTTSATSSEYFQISSELGSPVLALSKTGKVGIGTTNIEGSHSLFVAGSILTEEVEVKLMVDWPDYVFDTGYELMTLNEIDRYIRVNGHLPGVPSAEEIETNGLELGQMNAVLMQKVEELTLHLINQEKEINKLKEQINELRN